VSTIADCLVRSGELPASESPVLDLQLLLCHVLQVPRTTLYARPGLNLTPLQLAEFELLLARRAQGIPMAYLLGYREFWSLKLAVEPRCLVPRPETECLVEAALALPLPAEGRVLDLGTGCGAIALALASERPQWQVTGIDIDPFCVSLAQRNAAALGIANAAFALSDWFDAVSGRFQLIVANPPYIALDDPHLVKGDVRHEPRRALVSGSGGLDAIRHIVHDSCDYLDAGGWLLVEHGWQQGDLVVALLAGNGFHEVECRRDLSGNDRFAIGRWPGQAAPTVR